MRASSKLSLTANYFLIARQTLRAGRRWMQSERHSKPPTRIDPRRVEARRARHLRFVARHSMTTTFRIGRTTSDETEGSIRQRLYSPPRKRGGVRGGVNSWPNLSPSPSPRAERGEELSLDRVADD